MPIFAGRKLQAEKFKRCEEKANNSPKTFHYITAFTKYGLALSTADDSAFSHTADAVDRFLSVYKHYTQRTSFSFSMYIRVVERGSFRIFRGRGHNARLSEERIAERV